MSYSIEYEPHKKRLYPKVKNKKQIRLMKSIICLTLLFALTFICRSEPVRNYLIPGDPQITKAAYETMLEQMRQGNSLNDAVAAFCVQVIRNEP